MSKKVLLSSLKMATATFSSRILGLVREQAMAAAFGASGLTDAFTIAYRVPNMLRDLFAEGAFSSAFVPVFTEIKQMGEQEARRLLWSLFVLLGSITSFLSLLIIIFAPEIVQLFTNELFTSDQHRFELTTLLVRIMAPFLVFISLAALFMGALNALKVFFIPSLAPAFFNVVMILCIWFLPPVLKERGMEPIVSLALGVLLGGFVQMLVQLPMIFKKAYGPLGPIQLINKSTKKIMHRIGIGTVGIAATQINILVTTILATGTTIGAVSWLTYAFRLFQFPVGILSVSIAGSNLVHFSDAWKKGEKEQAVDLLKSSYILSIITIVPAFALLYAMAGESINLVFERGAFDRHDTLMSTKALHFYLLGLPFYGLYKIFAPTFFTLDKPKIPVKISVFSILCNVIFCVTMIYGFGYGFEILAFGTSLSMLINTNLQAYFLSRILKLKLSFFFNLKILKILIAGSVCLFCTRYLTMNYFDFELGFFLKLYRFCTIGMAGAMSYFLVLAVLGELSLLKRVIKRK
jgi:putative peptidoglycan lipid II flippase